MKQTKKLIERLESVKYFTPESVYSQLTGRKPRVYSLPLSSLFGSSFINLDHLLIRSVNEGVNLENPIKTEIQRIIKEYKRKQIIENSSLLDNLSPEDKQELSTLIDKLYDSKDFLKKFGDGYLSNYTSGDKLINIIDASGDLYIISLDSGRISQEIKGLKLEPLFNPPKDLQDYQPIYGSKYGVLIIELGACKHILIPDALSPYCKIGEEPEYPYFPDESNRELRKSLSKSKFTLVPSEPHCPQFLEYKESESELTWKNGASLFKMKLYLPRSGPSKPR